MKKDDWRGWRVSVPGETSGWKDPPEFLSVCRGRDEGRHLADQIDKKNIPHWIGICCSLLPLKVRTNFGTGRSSLWVLWLSYHKGFHALGPKDLPWALLSWEGEPCIRFLWWLLLCVNLTGLNDTQITCKTLYLSVTEVGGHPHWQIRNLNQKPI